MYTLGIPKRDYRRATQVLDYESQPSIPYHENLQDDGFYMFTFPEAGDEDDFRAIVIKLKGEGIRVIGADAQLTERQIMKLIDLVPLKEESTGAFGATSEELADMYSLKMLQQFRDEVMMDMKQKDGPIADMYGGQLNGLDKAIAIKRGKTKDVPYDVAIGRMTQDEYDKMMSTVKPDRASFEKSSKFGRMNETTEKAWNAIDVSRKAEKEISNKEWNERTGKKLDILKKLNDMGKFKKDFNDERLQGWVDQNYSWEKLSKQFKLNEMYSEMYEQNTRSGEFKVKIPVQRPRAGDGEYMDFYQKMEDVTIKYGHATGPLDDVTISWGNESHNVDFDEGDVIDDHGNEGKDMTFVAYSQDDKWRFIVDVSVGFNYEESGEIQNVDWDTLEIAVDDSKIREGVRKAIRKEIKKLHEAK